MNCPHRWCSRFSCCCLPNHRPAPPSSGLCCLSSTVGSLPRADPRFDGHSVLWLYPASVSRLALLVKSLADMVQTQLKPSIHHLLCLVTENKSLGQIVLVRTTFILGPLPSKSYSESRQNSEAHAGVPRTACPGLQTVTMGMTCINFISSYPRTSALAASESVSCFLVMMLTMSDTSELALLALSSDPTCKADAQIS